MTCCFMVAGKCKVLLEPYNCERCSFRLTERQYRERREKANERLRSLAFAEQGTIADHYYNGHAPWNKEG